jgi:hypothetical protein
MEVLAAAERALTHVEQLVELADEKVLGAHGEHWDMSVNITVSNQ